MKKKILFILALAAVLLSACKMKLSENTGTVIIDFGSNERAVESNGLPVIKDAEMSLEITSSNGSEKKEFAAGQEKTWSGSFPVGERIGIKVTISTASAEWKGSTGHTVKEGANKVEIKLKKSVAALKGLLFGTNKQLDSAVASGHRYTLTLKIGSKEITKTAVENHSFCRDNKGRTYLAYNTDNQWNIERYTSEGDKESKTFNLPERCYGLILAGDHATGAVYLVAESDKNMKLYRIKEDGSFEEITLEGEGVANIKIIRTIAVYNDILIAYIGSSELSSFKISGNKAEKLKDYALNDDQKIELQGASYAAVLGEIKDLYMTADTLYVLFSKYKTAREYFSLGGIVKYSYNPADGTISKIKRIGIEDSHTAQNGIYPTDESNFYGPVKVIGFDEENLYIADDGIKFEFQKGKPRLTANKNRIAALKKEDDTLTFTDAPSGITWMSENPVWTGVNTKIIVWKKTPDPGNIGLKGFYYYQLASATEQPKDGGTDSNLLAALASLDNYFTDVFCFDEAGNLYIAQWRQPSSYVIHRYKLQDNGSYADSTDTITISSYDKLVAIAVDISGSVKTADGQSVNALYYSYNENNKSCIKRFIWKGDAFSSAAADTSFVNGTGHPTGTLEGSLDTQPPLQTKTRFTALAADKNGFFVGETFTNKTTKKYTIKVKKYAHTAAGYTNTTDNIEVVPETVYYSSTGGSIEFSLSENLNALYIQDGILFGVTAKEFRNDYDSEDYPQKASISGRLWKIGKTDAAFTADTLKRLHSSEPDPWPGDDNGERKEGGKFAPYRFIAVKPKELVIASDGFYGWVEGPRKKAAQYNFIWTFELKADGSTGEPNSADKGTGITFSKELKAESGFPWE